MRSRARPFVRLFEHHLQIVHPCAYPSALPRLHTLTRPLALLEGSRTLQARERTDSGERSIVDIQMSPLLQEGAAVSEKKKGFLGRRVRWQ